MSMLINYLPIAPCPQAPQQFFVSMNLTTPDTLYLQNCTINEAETIGRAAIYIQHLCEITGHSVQQKN